MQWFILSFLTALFQSLSDLFSKIALRKQGILSISLLKLAVPVPLLFLLYPHFPRHIPSQFWVTLALLAPLDVTATILYQESIKYAPLSLTLPLLAFSPAFIIVTGWIILGEKLSVVGITGVIMVTTGAYILNLESLKEGIFAPILAIFRNRGTRLMFIVAFIYSINSVLGKRMVLMVDPLFFSWFYFLVLSILLFPITIYKENPIKNWRKTPLFSLLIALSYAAMIVFHFEAVRIIDVAYMISIKRFSLVLGSIWGIIFLKERGGVTRVAGSLIMFMGVVVILLGA